MATKLSDVKYYCNGDGSYSYSSVIGWESSRTRVVRFNFTTGSTGATSIKIATTSGTISLQDGTSMSKMPFYVTTSDSSHANALASGGYAVTGYLTKSNNVWSGSADILLKENTKYYVWFFPYDKTYGWSYWHNNSTYYTTYELSGTSKFTLSTSAGTGSSITVNRTSSSLASTGNLSNGATIYKNDRLKITFTPSTNYRITTNTVNGSTFTSGNTHTVSSNVTVVAAATPQKSLVAATDANIGSTSTITVTRYSTSYTHTITYTFGSAIGTICTKSSSTSIAWTVPPAFYAEIPNATSGTCTLTITTYNGSTSLGTESCTLTVSTTSASCAPTVTGTVVDTNSTTIALTGDSSILVRYKSNAECTLTATPQNSASISTVKIRGTAVTGTTSSGVTTATKSYTNTSYTSYAFSATDSRGYTTSKTVSPTVVKYIKLTCNPTITRNTPTDGIIMMSISGAFYKGSFGAASNTLTLKYRFKTSSGSWSDWYIVSNVSTGTSSYSVAKFSVNDATGTEEFNYKESFIFEVQAIDGTSDYPLTTVKQTVTVQKGIPVFDWGENDFNVNVALMLNNVNILDIMYPVGAVYMHSSSTIPTAVSGVGTWSSVTTGIDGVYAWKRTA